MQDLKLIKTNKNEQCEKIFFALFIFVHSLIVFLLIFRKRLKYNQ